MNYEYELFRTFAREFEKGNLNSKNESHKVWRDFGWYRREHT